MLSAEAFDQTPKTRPCFALRWRRRVLYVNAAVLSGGEEASWGVQSGEERAVWKLTASASKVSRSHSPLQLQRTMWGGKTTDNMADYDYDSLCECGWSCGPCGVSCGCDYCEDTSNDTTTTLITVWASYILIVLFIIAMMRLFKHFRHNKSHTLLSEEETVWKLSARTSILSRLHSLCSCKE